jgi:CubicO group peptidase (beta-lactamase class C family)
MRLKIIKSRFSKRFLFGIEQMQVAILPHCNTLNNKHMKHCRHFLVGTFFLLTISFQTLSQQSQPLPIAFDKVIKDHLSSDSIGCVVLIAKGGKVIFKKAYGKVDIELNVPTTPEMVFEIGSVSKQFTAVGILKLAEEGKLGLKDDIRKYFPDFKTGNYTITLENLLSHTSGITDDVKEFDENRMDFSVLSKSQMLALFKDIPLKFEPGTEVSYSSAAYLMLGYIIEQVSGKKYADFINEAFFKPLNMKTACIPELWEIVPNLAKGYERNKVGKIVKSRPDYIRNDPAGGLVMSAEDYLKWHNALWTNRIIKNEWVEKATKPYILKDGNPAHFGLGFEIDDAFGVSIIHHGGRNFGYNSHEMYAPKDDVLVVVFNNQSMSDFTSLATILTHLAVGKGYNYKEVKVSEKITDAYIGKYKWNEVTEQHVLIFKKNGKLYFKDSTSQFPSEMHFTSDISFFIYDYGFMMVNTFLKDKTGKIKGFNVKGNGESFDSKKVE